MFLCNEDIYILTEVTYFGNEAFTENIILT